MATERYPLIRIKLFISDEEQLSYLDLTSNDSYEFRVYYYADESVDPVLIAWDDSDLTIDSLDLMTLSLIRDSGNFALLKEEGTATVAAYYEKDGIVYYIKQEFVLYNNFFRENYLDLLTSYDKTNILENTYTRILFETCMEFFDIIYAYMQDIKNVRDPIDIKYRFLNVLGNSLGFGSLQRRGEITDSEIISVRLYRELLNNLFDLLKIRGTRLAYELFFGALGYDIELLEYWFDDEGNLIEIDPIDDTNSTFYGLDTDGVPLEDSPIARNDPRKDLDANGQYNRNQKSPYVKPVIGFREGFSGIISYSNEERLLLREYLEWLRPNHILYLNEVIAVALPQAPDIDELPELYDTDDSVTLVDLFQPYAYFETVETYPMFQSAVGANWNNLSEILEDDIDYAYYDLTSGSTTDTLELDDLNAYDSESEIVNVILNILARIDESNALSPINVGIKVLPVTIYAGDDIYIQGDVSKVGVKPLIKYARDVEVSGIIKFRNNAESIRVTVDSISIGQKVNFLTVIEDTDVTVFLENISIGISIQESRSWGDDTIVGVSPIQIAVNVKYPTVPLARVIIDNQDWSEGWNNFEWIITEELGGWDWEDIDRMSVELEFTNNNSITHQIQVAFVELQILSGKNEMTMDLRPLRVYTNDGTTERIGYDYKEGYTDVIGNSFPADPGRLDYVGPSGFGIYQNTGGGIAVEDLFNMTEEITLSLPVSITDIIHTLPKYDGKLYYDGYVFDESAGGPTPAKPPEGTDVPPIYWNDETWMDIIGEDTYGRPTSNALYYDTGILLEESDINILNLLEFQEQYDEYFTQGYNTNQVKTLMTNLYSITANQYDYIVENILN